MNSVLTGAAKSYDLSSIDVLTIADLMKSFLRKLPEPLVPSTLFRLFLMANGKYQLVVSIFGRWILTHAPQTCLKLSSSVTFLVRLFRACIQLIQFCLNIFSNFYRML